MTHQIFTAKHLCMMTLTAILLSTSSGLQATPVAPAPVKLHVAIYRDKGVWPIESSRALPALLEGLGGTYIWVDAAAVNAGVLRKNGKPAFDLLIVPGGWAADYIAQVGGWDAKGPGDDEIRNFVKAGGGYLGFCAGAFAAASTTRWVGKDYAYTWKLFDGYAVGPLKWNPLTSKGLLGAVHGTAVLDLKATELVGRGLPATVRPTLYGGPHFVLRDPNFPPTGYKVLAEHGEDSTAAIVTFRYPDKDGGQVVLCSFHPSVLTDDGALYDRDHETLAFAGAGKDPDGEAPDLQLAGALVEIAAGIPAHQPHSLKSN
jgi:glutamine amidotransferase-like uncharacterized protein